MSDRYKKIIAFAYLIALAMAICSEMIYQFLDRLDKIPL